MFRNLHKISSHTKPVRSRLIKKLEKAIADAENRITELEDSIAVIETKLATPEGASDASLYTDYSNLKNELSETMDKWTELTIEKDRLTTENA